MGNKVMHGQFIRSTDRQLITEEEDTILWLSKLNEDNGSEIIATQNQALQITCDKNITNRNRQQMKTK
jgi:hypothetical protein